MEIFNFSVKMEFIILIKMKKIVVLEVPHAQESNQLIQHVNFDSFCAENNALFFNPKFLYLSKSIQNSTSNKFFGLILTNKIVRKVLIKLKVAKYHKFYSPIMKNSFEIGFITYVKGWYFRNRETFDRDKSYYALEFNKKLQKEDYYENSAVLKVALHIRRGDYEFFQEGRYFLNDNQYITALNNVLSDINEPFEIIVFGNDPKLNRDIYSSIGYHISFSDGSIYQDYYRMSKCKILIGPSSTFSIWAQLISNDNMKKIVIDKYNYDQVRLSNAF
jgi:hypothetical protein